MDTLPGAAIVGEVLSGDGHIHVVGGNG
jgi:hypothetical protein